MSPFIIYALPRSRTAWLSAFLTYGTRRCGHDIVIDLPELKKLRAFFTIPNVGTVETGMVMGWKLINKFVPNIKTVVIRRPLEDIKASLKKFGLESDAELEQRNKLLDEVAAQPGVMSFDFHDLNTEEACKSIFEYCLELPFDRKWWKLMRNKNIQIDLKAQMEKIQENKEAIEALKLQAMKLLEAA